MIDRIDCAKCNMYSKCIENKDKTGKYICFGFEPIEKPQTNEEWRKTCSVEEFAEWVSNLAYACMRCGMSGGEAYCHTGYCIQDKEDAMRWLKQPHTTKEY